MLSEEDASRLRVDQRGTDLVSAPALVARDVELDRAVRAVVSPPAVVLVEGEAGIGKTRLVRELLARPEVADRRVILGGCLPLREPLPFGPVIEALRRLETIAPERELSPVAGALHPLVPELAGQLPAPLDPLGDSRGDRHCVFRAILDVLSALGPAVCVLEDLHWSDESTNDLLRFLVSQLPEELSLVLTYRREDTTPPAAVLGLASRKAAEVARTTVSLAPLGAEDVRHLVTEILQVDDVSREFAEYLHARTLGVPFAVEEVLGLLKDRRDLVRRDGRWARRTLDTLEVPAAIRDLTLERLAGLSRDAVQIVRAAAVAAVPLPAGALARAAGLSSQRAARATSELLARGLLHEHEDDDQLGFRHVLARQATYDAIPTPERPRLHLRVAQVLEQRPAPQPLAQIAHHYRRGGLPRKWLRYAEAAADLAISLGNTAAACHLLTDALVSENASAPTRARLAVKLGRATLGSLDHERATSVLRQVLDEAELPARVRGEVRLYVGLVLDNQGGQAAAGLAEVARAVPELRRRPGLAARAMSVLAVPMSSEGHLTDHLSWMNRAVDAAARADDPMLALAVLVNRATVLMHVGDPQAWRAVLDLPQEPTSLEERRQLLRASVNLAHACSCTGHYEQAQRFRARGLALSAEEGESYLAAALEATSLLLDWVTGEWDGLEARAWRLARGMEDVPAVFAESAFVIGHLLRVRGDEDAKGQLLSAHDVGLRCGSIPVVVGSLGGLARIELDRGDAEAGCTLALEAIELVRRKGIWVWSADVASVAIEALLAAEREQDATALVSEVAKGLRGRDAPAAQAALAGCRATLSAAAGRHEQAARVYAKAERAWLGLPRPYEAALCREGRARQLALAGKADAKDLLLQVLARFEALGAGGDAARVRRTLREHGVRQPWRGGRRGYGNQLSPREEEVARLAASGRTNREIAEALVLSPRTVEDHLSKALRKLGVSSRTALAGTLRG